MELTEPYEPTPAEIREFRMRVLQQKVLRPVPENDESSIAPGPKLDTDHSTDQSPPTADDSKEARRTKPDKTSLGTIVWPFAILAAVTGFIYFGQSTGNDGSVIRNSDFRLIDLPEPTHTNLFRLAGGIIVFGSVVITVGVAWGLRGSDFAIQGPVRFVWDQRGIHRYTEHASQLYHWESIDRWYESGHLIAAGVSSQWGIMLPKAALTPQQTTELTTLLRKKLGEPKGGFADAD